MNEDKMKPDANMMQQDANNAAYEKNGQLMKALMTVS